LRQHSFFFRLFHKIGEVLGVDLSPDMLAKAKKKVKSKYKITFICGDATCVPYPDSCFDAACVSFALHDMPEEIGLATLCEMKRVVKPDGKIIIVDYNAAKWHGSILKNKFIKLWESQYYDDFERKGLQCYLEEAGLQQILEKTYVFGFVRMVMCPVIK
jgi:demethylmenaquinone methyltransferase/2-methoxy-6-polyprenyl-1,4-benzoquinol methylase